MTGYFCHLHLPVLCIFSYTVYLHVLSMSIYPVSRPPLDLLSASSILTVLPTFPLYFHMSVFSGFTSRTSNVLSMCCPSDVLICDPVHPHYSQRGPQYLHLLLSLLFFQLSLYHPLLCIYPAAILDTTGLCCVATLSPTTNLQSSHSDYIIYKICGSPVCSCFCYTITSS